jgi:hypothetical protein
MHYVLLSYLLLFWGPPACDRSGGAMRVYSSLSPNLAFLKLGIEACFLKQGVSQTDFCIICSILYLILLQSYLTPAASQTQRCFFILSNLRRCDFP